MNQAIQIPLPGIEPNPVDRVPLALRPAIAKFLDHCRVGKRLADHTLRAYEGDLADFAAHVGKVAVSDIDRDAVRSYARMLLDARGLKETSVKRHVAALKVFFRWLEREQFVAVSVFHRLDFALRLPKCLPRALDTDDIHRLIATAERDVAGCPADSRFDAQATYFALVVLFTTGVRVGELTSVRLEDVSSRDAAIRVRGKGNRERRVYLPGRRAAAALEVYLAARMGVREGGMLFVTSVGRPLTARAVRKRLHDLASRAGIERRVTPHMLRHTAATQLLEAGVDIRLVQKLLGHASIATTQIYAHVSDTTLQARLAQADTLSRIAGGQR